jgi:hypothetical protein
MARGGHPLRRQSCAQSSRISQHVRNADGHAVACYGERIERGGGWVGAHLEQGRASGRAGKSSEPGSEAGARPSDEQGRVLSSTRPLRLMSAAHDAQR